jgi:pilus assembly protein CpaE
MHTLTAGLIIENKDLRDELHALVAELPVRILFDEPSVGNWTSLEERLSRTAADLVIIDAAAAGNVEEAVGRIRSAAHKPAVIVLHTEADSVMILQALRAGASEYLFPPIANPLKSALERITGERAPVAGAVRKGARTVGFLGAKGGCGVTTIACHVAVEIPARTKQELLLVDCDLQAGLVSYMMKSRSGYSVADVAGNIHRLDQSYWRGVVSNGKPGVEVLSAPETPSGREVQLPNMSAVLGFARTQYDWVLVDMGRSVTAATLTIAEAMDQLYIVTTAELPALHQTKQTLDTLTGVGYPRERVQVVLNRMPRRMDVSVKELDKMLGANICVTIPDDPGPLADAMADGKLLDSANTLGRHFGRLAAKICGLEAEPPVKKLFGFF